jgi:hypothetical protein
LIVQLLLKDQQAAHTPTLGQLVVTGQQNAVLPSGPVGQKEIVKGGFVDGVVTGGSKPLCQPS